MSTALELANLKVAFIDVLAEACFVKNAQLEYGGFSPYTAVFGRMPRGLFSPDDSTV